MESVEHLASFYIDKGKRSRSASPASPALSGPSVPRKKKKTAAEQEKEELARLHYLATHFYSLGPSPALDFSFADVVARASQFNFPNAWNLPQEFSLEYIAAIPPFVKEDARCFARAFMRTNTTSLLSAEAFVQHKDGLCMNICDPLSRATQDLVDILQGRQIPVEDTLSAKFKNVLAHVNVGEVNHLRSSELKPVYDMSRFILNNTFRLRWTTPDLNLNGNAHVEEIGLKGLRAVERMLNYDVAVHPLMGYFKACAILFQLMVLVFPQEDAPADFWIDSKAGYYMPKQMYERALKANYGKVKNILERW